ncbi:DUF6221 family protein [Streptomyces sp. NPDC055642]
MDDLVRWLSAQLDEDERTARATAWSASTQTDNPWNAQPPRHEGEGWTVWAKVGRFLMFRDLEEADARHIAEHDPARVLREIDAKRRVLDWYKQRAAVDSRGEDPDDYENVTGSTLETVVQMLALPYADRPGYREEWRP